MLSTITFSVAWKNMGTVKTMDQFLKRNEKAGVVAHPESKHFGHRDR